MPLFEALHRFGVLAAFLRVADDEARFAAQALKHFHQVVGLHRQLGPLPPLALAPAEILHQADVFDELKAKPLGLLEILLVLQRVEEVTY